MSKTDIAKQTGFTRRGVQKMIEKGLTEEEIIQKGDAPKKAKPRQPGKLTDEQARNQAALADLNELRAAQLREELVDKEEVNQWIGGMIVSARKILTLIGTQLQDKLAQESDPAKVRSIIDAEVDRALRELSTYKPS